MRLIYCTLLVCCLAASTAFATAEIALVDGSGVEYYINTNITFSTTSSSASGAVSDATYTTIASGVTTTGGETVSTFLSDAFDGYNGMLVGVDGGQLDVYNDNGTAAVADGGRTVMFNTQTFGELNVRREVFVPDDDSFCRWLNVFTNAGSTTHSVVLRTANDLGSDIDTTIDTTSSGDAIADTTDQWVVTYEMPFDTFSNDPRLGHVLQGEGASTGLSAITFENGDEFPTWQYTFDVAPGQTVIIMNFVTGQPNLAAAADKAAALAAVEGSALDFMTQTEKDQVINFDLTTPAPPRAGFNCFGGTLNNLPGPLAWTVNGGDVLVLVLVLSFLLITRKTAAAKRTRS